MYIPPDKVIYLCGTLVSMCKWRKEVLACQILLNQDDDM